MAGGNPTLADLNRSIREAGIPIELVRGDGYHYFIFDDDKHFETESMYVRYTKAFTRAQWIELARTAYQIINDRISNGDLSND